MEYFIRGIEFVTIDVMQEGTEIARGKLGGKYKSQFFKSNNKILEKLIAKATDGYNKISKEEFRQESDIARTLDGCSIENFFFVSNISNNSIEIYTDDLRKKKEWDPRNGVYANVSIPRCGLLGYLFADHKIWRLNNTRTDSCLVSFTSKTEINPILDSGLEVSISKAILKVLSTFSIKLHKHVEKFGAVGVRSLDDDITVIDISNINISMGGIKCDYALIQRFASVGFRQIDI
jgi:hypothetical protein